jgi:hypothetical protein
MDWSRAVLVIDAHGSVVQCSAALARLAGRREAELVGRPAWVLLPGWTPFDGPRAPCSARLIAEAGNAVIPVDVRCETAHLHGETLYVVELRDCRPR